MSASPFGPAELRRYVASLWKPATALTVAVGATAVALTHRHLLSDEIGEAAARAFVPIAAIGLTVLGVWCAWSLHRALTQPRRDAAAAAHLAHLRGTAHQPGCYLIVITQTQWATTAGRRVWAVDTSNGGVADYWLPTATPVREGSWVLVRLPNGRPPEVLGTLPPGAVQSANRHAQAMARDDRRLDHQGAEQAEVDALIREAERITREH